MIIVEGIDYIVIPTGDIEASVKFYSELFDFETIEEKERIRNHRFGFC